MPTAVAKRLDAAELQRQEAMGHHGRQRMKNTELLNLGATPLSPSGAPKPAVLPTNVITVNFERSAA
jgi:hypothetical protein